MTDGVLLAETRFAPLVVVRLLSRPDGVASVPRPPLRYSVGIAATALFNAAKFSW